MILCFLIKINMFLKKYFDIVFWIKDEKKILLIVNYVICVVCNKYKVFEVKRLEFFYIRLEEIIC